MADHYESTQAVPEADIERREPDYTTDFPAYPSHNEHPEDFPLTSTKVGVRRDKQLGRTFIAAQFTFPDTFPHMIFPAQVPMPNGGTRRSVTITVLAGGTIFFDGNSQVDASHGFPIALNASLTFDKEPWGEGWIVAPTAGTDIRVLIEYGYGGSFTELP